MTKRLVYPMAIGTALAVFVTHLVSLPIGITFDGLYYIHLADIIGSPNFPSEWYPPRAPLFPLTLKGAFWLLGRQAMAPIFVSTCMGFATVMVLGSTARRMTNEWAAAAVVLLVTLYPTAVAYQHYALTEVGTGFFLALTTALLLWEPKGVYASWGKAFALGGAITAGYYWRETLQTLALVAAFLYLITSQFPIGRPSQKRTFYATRLVLLTQVIIIGITPYLLGSIWSHYTNESAWKNIVLKQGLFRQALLPTDDPSLGESKHLYKEAIRNSLSAGNFYSGIRFDLLDQVLNSLPSGTNDPQKLFFQTILKHPHRYFAAACRTIMLFGGAGALVSENRIFRAQILSGTSAMIGDGPAEIHDPIVREFQQTTTNSALRRLVINLCAPYDYLVIGANIATLFGLFYGLAVRDFRLITLCLLPITFVLFYVFILASIDRYAFPAYPLVLANLIILPLMYRRRTRVTQKQIQLADTHVTDTSRSE